jgi:hypothetical protein
MSCGSGVGDGHVLNALFSKTLLVLIGDTLVPFVRAATLLSYKRHAESIKMRFARRTVIDDLAETVFMPGGFA